jgi:hypothetical protein
MWVSIANVTVRNEDRSQWLIGGAVGTVDGNRISVGPPNASDTRWLPIPDVDAVYHVSDGNNSWTVTCTSPPGRDYEMADFTAFE